MVCGLDFGKLHRGHRGPQRFGRPAGEWVIVCEGAVLFFERFDNHGFHGFERIARGNSQTAGLYLCNPCNPWLNIMVHVQEMLWCLDGLTELCGSLRALCNCLEFGFCGLGIIYGGRQRGR